MTAELRLRAELGAHTGGFVGIGADGDGEAAVTVHVLRSNFGMAVEPA
jgi:hypothetical protein